MKLKFIKNEISLGLEISDDRVSVVAVQKGKGEQKSIELDKSMALPAGIVKNGSLEDEGRLLAVLETLLKEFEDNEEIDYFINFAIPENIVYYFHFNIQSVEKNKVDVIRSELSKRSPINIDELEYKYQLQATEGGEKVFVVALDKKIFSQWKNFFHNYNLPIRHFFLEGQANFYSQNFGNRNNTIAILDLCCNRTNISFFQKGALVYASSYRYGENDFINKLIKKFPELEKNHDLGVLQKNNEYFKACEEAIEAVVDRIKKEINFYDKTFKIEINEIIVLGELFEKAEILRYFRESIAFPINRSNLVLPDLKEKNQKIIASGLSLLGLQTKTVFDEIYFLASSAKPKAWYVGVLARTTNILRENKLLFLVLLAFIFLVLLIYFLLPDSRKSEEGIKEINITKQAEPRVLTSFGVSTEEEEDWLLGRFVEVEIEAEISSEPEMQKARQKARNQINDDSLIFPYPINYSEGKAVDFPLTLKFLSLKKNDLNIFLQEKIISDINYLDYLFRLTQVRENIEEKIFIVEIELNKIPQIKEQKISLLPEFGKLKIKSNLPGLNVRSGPGLGNAIIGTAKRDSEYYYMALNDNWIKIVLNNKSLGWVNMNYIDFID